jgi:hypothetical protein
MKGRGFQSAVSGSDVARLRSAIELQTRFGQGVGDRRHKVGRIRRPGGFFRLARERIGAPTKSQSEESKWRKVILHMPGHRLNPVN